jgi:hypothetical protein
MTSGGTHLRTWVTDETKQRFAALARQLGLSESALLRRSVNLILSSTAVVEPAVEGPAKVPRDLRLSVRLRPDDHVVLRERAISRGIPPATYVSMVLRAHLRAVTPLPDREFTELKRAIGELGMIGRNLNQIARVANQGSKVVGPSAADLRAVLRALEGLRDHVKALLLANTASWESGRAEAGS